VQILRVWLACDIYYWKEKDECKMVWDDFHCALINILVPIFEDTKFSVKLLNLALCFIYKTETVLVLTTLNNERTYIYEKALTNRKITEIKNVARTPWFINTMIIASSAIIVCQTSIWSIAPRARANPIWFHVNIVIHNIRVYPGARLTDFVCAIFSLKSNSKIT